MWGKNPWSDKCKSLGSPAFLYPCTGALFWGEILKLSVSIFHAQGHGTAEYGIPWVEQCIAWATVPRGPASPHSQVCWSAALVISFRVGSRRSKLPGYSWRSSTGSQRRWLCGCDSHRCSPPDPLPGWVQSCFSCKYVPLCFNQGSPVWWKAHCCSKPFRFRSKPTDGSPWLLPQWRRRNARMQEECPVPDRGPRWHLGR